MNGKHLRNMNGYYLPIQWISRQGRGVNKVSLPRGAGSWAPEAEILEGKVEKECFWLGLKEQGKERGSRGQATEGSDVQTQF